MARRSMLLRRLAWVCAVMVLLIMSLSAYLRLSKVGLGCEPWPQCYGQALRAADAAPPATDGATAAARMIHRVVASVTLLLVLVMVMTALALRPVLWPEGRLALGLLALVLFLAVLGRWTAQARLPAVTLGNLLGGIAMFALSVRLALVTARSPAPSVGRAPPIAWIWLAGLLVLAQAALGGLVSTGHAGLSCPALGACDLGAGSWQALVPWVEPPAGALPTHAGGALVHVLHRAGGLLLVAALLVLAWRARRQGQRTVAMLLVGLPALQVVLGLVLVALDLPLALVLAHNLTAALLLALLLSISVPQRNPMLLPAL
ncbi:MAG TPA: COX15/CtaA family protein [Burkholderiaceae bacterium]|nr:COX15/CtaA family protein [Burkholderiaceae bacterium]